MEKQIADNLDISTNQVQGALQLLNDGNTVPFIARYRKEQTGGLNEVQIRNVKKEADKLQALEDRRETILETIQEQGALTDQLETKIQNASSQTELEDLYTPYRPRRQTRATRAREANLEPVARAIEENRDLRKRARSHRTEEYPTVEDVLQGARDILAEEMAHDPDVRKFLRKKARNEGKISCTKRRGADGDPTFETYTDFSEPVERIDPHQVLAIRRGESEKELSAELDLNDELMVKMIARNLVEADGETGKQHRKAIQEGYKRLLLPAIERDVRGELEQQADQHAIQNFSINLKNLLLQPPMPDSVILGIDPGLRTGCKMAVIDETGTLLETETCYVHDDRRDNAIETIQTLVHQFHVDLVAIGNGTASRKTEKTVSRALKETDDIQFAIIDEAGASVYSASEIAREEFPNLDVSMRGAVSIARRLQDPLAELVKIDPRSIGVGMYQHDVDQNDLEEALNAVVEDVVNSVGVDLNSASIPLLSRVAGIGSTLAERIVEYREEHGEFHSREQLKNVRGMGPKTFRQCAGFLRIRNGTEPLDNTGIHPENYDFARSILTEVNARPGSENLDRKLTDLRQNGQLEQLADRHDAGPETRSQLLEALQTPGRDPRDQLDPPDLRSDVLTMEDLEKGMQLQGKVRNVVDFGAFVDIGVKEDGLLHISEMADRYIDNPHEEVNAGDQLQVVITDIDLEQNQISLSRKGRKN